MADTRGGASGRLTLPFQASRHLHLHLQDACHHAAPVLTTTVGVLTRHVDREPDVDVWSNAGTYNTAVQHTLAASLKHPVFYPGWGLPRGFFCSVTPP